MDDKERLFHKLSNLHNKISVIAGANKETLKTKGLNSVSCLYLIGVFEQIEQFVFSADRVVKDIKTQMTTDRETTDDHR